MSDEWLDGEGLFQWNCPQSPPQNDLNYFSVKPPQIFSSVCYFVYHRYFVPSGTWITLWTQVKCRQLLDTILERGLPKIWEISERSIRHSISIPFCWPSFNLVFRHIFFKNPEWICIGRSLISGSKTWSRETSNGIFNFVISHQIVDLLVGSFEQVLWWQNSRSVLLHGNEQIDCDHRVRYFGYIFSPYCLTTKRSRF
jgi:hypothetical protein